MDKSLYEYLMNISGRMFSFASDGTKKIDKIVLFLPTECPDSYAIVLGDLQHDGSIDVSGKSVNGDAEFVLSMVGRTIAFFLSDYPDAEVLIEATSPSRTRLFRMAIARELHELGDYLDVYGVDNDTVEIFQTGKTYLRYAVTLRND